MQWDPPSWNEPVYSVAFSSDNRHFAAAGAFRSPMVLADIPVWDAYAPTSAPLRLGTGIDAVLVRFSATGARLALTRADGRVEVWNLRNSNTPSAILTGALGTFGPDDNLLACVRGRRTLEIWDLRNTARPESLSQRRETSPQCAFGTPKIREIRRKFSPAKQAA
jgi:WD40 repeat protein